MHATSEPRTYVARRPEREGRSRRWTDTVGSIMPRIALVLLAGCAFDGNYTGGHFRCSDGKCPSGLTCTAGVCVAPDAQVVDAPIDARPTALTCADPGVLPPAGATTNGTTAGRANTVTSTCGGFVMNRPDAVYRITTTSGAQVSVAIAGSYPVNAYVIAPCTVAPGTPQCEGNALASPGVPITVPPPGAGDQFVVVDGVNAGLSGAYTLTVTVP